ncbi:MAG: rhodanese-like domain-containing protein [Crocinitomicaceae bacterium]|nr:MAG: rhodanese-like domain-containing protein [Crocinitomicaceae bacterium]
MLEALKKMLGIGPKADFKELIKNGAVIIDVRSKGEFQGGHIRGAINIPLDRIQSEASKLKKDKAIITCCASGMRSSSAKSLLQAKGFEVYNGGGWSSLNSKLN